MLTMQIENVTFCKFVLYWHRQYTVPWAVANDNAQIKLQICQDSQLLMGDVCCRHIKAAGGQLGMSCKCNVEKYTYQTASIFSSIFAGATAGSSSSRVVGAMGMVPSHYLHFKI